MNKVIDIKSKRKRRRWKHPFIAKVKSWFSIIIHKFYKPQVRPKSNEDKETFIQGLIRINNQVNMKSTPPKNVRELVPYKMYKARDLLIELRKQKETLVKEDIRRNKNIN